VSPDSRLLLAFGALLVLIGAVLIGLVVRAWYLNRRKARARRRRELVRQRAVGQVLAAEKTRVFKRAEWRELWRQIDDETHILRRVDPTALPKRPKTHTGRRWLR
jgi:hypothetical protein